METDRFWVVLRDGMTMTTMYRHSSRESAKNEAKRLAKENRGARFYVAAVTGYAQIPEDAATWHELKSPNTYQPIDSDWP